MKRFFGVVAAVMLIAVPAFAGAQATKPAGKPAKADQMEKAAPAAKAMTMTGKVSAVAADSLTIKGKTDETTFKIDSSTKVIGTGASHKTAELKGQEKPIVITDFVKVGDNVRVTYHEKDGTKAAASVRVTTAKPAAK
jgi:hypothetical protein